MRRKILPLLLLLLTGTAQASVGEQPGANEAKTYQLHTIAVIRNAPEGDIIDVWNSDTLLTSSEVRGDWIRVTGHFPDGGNWRPSGQQAWINRHYLTTVNRQPQPKPSNRPAGVVRYIEVEKSSFELRVVEQRDTTREVLLKTTVALGMDSCLPREKGGRCYYTEPGEYNVRWKVHDPEGIEWCIPKSMEQEYAASLARGERCFRGSIGSHALNIGKSYAIHGTSNANSLGRKVSHGCVRTANQKMAQIYELMDVGDKVYIIE